MDDRELLKLAAKAAGMNWIDDRTAGLTIQRAEGGGIYNFYWNPLADKGDAKRLESELEMTTGFDDRFAAFGACAYCSYPTGEFSCDSIFQNIEQAGGKDAATRRAIVRAAAEIGKAMP